MEFFTELLVVFLTLAFLIYLYFRKSFNYWKNKNVPYIKPTIPFGNMGNPLNDNKGLHLRIKQYHEHFKSIGEKYGGIFVGTSPMLIVNDPGMIKNILTKDFQHFNSHGIVFNEKVDPLAAHLFSLEGQRWRDMRVKLTPTFTSGKMKMMFHTMLECSEQFKGHVDHLVKENKPLDIKEIMACFTTDVIGSCAFGIDCNSFTNPDGEFRKYGKYIFRPSAGRVFKRMVGLVAPALIRNVNIRQLDKEVTDFFVGVVRNIVDEREAKNIKRKDFMQLLIDMREEAKSNGHGEFTIEQMSAQVFVFFLAGFETSSTTMTFCLYELAHNKGIQDKIKQEIDSAVKKYDGKLTYDGIMEMKYLDQTVNETLRKYPPAATLQRKCTLDYKLPNGAVVQEGTQAFMSILALHNDPDNFPEPNKFDPDRFSDERKHDIIPYTYLPFGEGPRLCIGMRFGVMQAKIGLCLLLKDYEVTPHESLKYPMEFDPKTVVLSGKERILLVAKRR